MKGVVWAEGVVYFTNVLLWVVVGLDEEGRVDRRWVGGGLCLPREPGCGFLSAARLHLVCSSSRSIELQLIR